MIDPEQEFEYEQKCEQIAIEIETLILDGIIAALGRVKKYFQDDVEQNQKTSENIEPF